MNDKDTRYLMNDGVTQIKCWLINRNISEPTRSQLRVAASYIWARDLFDVCSHLEFTKFAEGKISIK